MTPEALRQTINKECTKLGLSKKKLSAIREIIMWAYIKGLQTRRSVT